MLKNFQAKQPRKPESEEEEDEEEEGLDDTEDLDDNPEQTLPQESPRQSPNFTVDTERIHGLRKKFRDKQFLVKGRLTQLTCSDSAQR